MPCADVMPCSASLCSDFSAQLGSLSCRALVASKAVCCRFELTPAVLKEAVRPDWDRAFQALQALLNAAADMHMVGAVIQLCDLRQLTVLLISG